MWGPGLLGDLGNPHVSHYGYSVHCLTFRGFVKNPTQKRDGLSGTLSSPSNSTCFWDFHSGISIQELMWADDFYQQSSPLHALIKRSLLLPSDFLNAYRILLLHYS